MALRNPDGLAVSFDSEDLIRELRDDIAELGPDRLVHVWSREVEGVTLYVNYDFIAPGAPVSLSEVEPGESLSTMPMGELLPLLEQQDAVL